MSSNHENRERREPLAWMRDLYHVDHTMERLRPPAFAVWSALLCLRWPGTPIAVVPRSQLIRASGVASKSTVSRALEELETKGYVQRLRPPADDRRVPAYFLNEEPRRPKQVSERKSQARSRRDELYDELMKELNDMVQEGMRSPGVMRVMEEYGPKTPKEEFRTGPGAVSDRGGGDSRPAPEPVQTGAGANPDRSRSEPDRAAMEDRFGAGLDSEPAEPASCKAGGNQAKL